MPLVDRAPAAGYDAPAWLSVGETARLLRLTTETLYASLKAGTFPFEAHRIGRVWRIRASDVHNATKDGTAALLDEVQDGAGE